MFKILEKPDRCMVARDNGDGTRTTFVPVPLSNGGALGMVVGATGTVLPGETLRVPETDVERAFVARTSALLSEETNR